MTNPERYAGHPKISEMESFATILKAFYLLAIVTKFSNFDFCEGPIYAFKTLRKNFNRYR